MQQTATSGAVTLQEFELMKQAALCTAEDDRHLQRSYEILKDQTDDVLDVWYGFVGSHRQLVSTFAPDGGQPDANYLAAVRERFAQWILDTASANYDQEWLDYQHEIGLRHHRTKKNATDGVDATAIVPFRYLFPLVFPVIHTLREFLAKGGDDEATIVAMQQAWLKSALLQLTLWSRPYVKDGDF